MESKRFGVGAAALTVCALACGPPSLGMAASAAEAQTEPRTPSLGIETEQGTERTSGNTTWLASAEVLRGLLQPPEPMSGASAGDPAPVSTRTEWEFTVGYSKGALTLQALRVSCSPQLTTTPRRLGRFALEFGIGPQLLDRARFDLPLLSEDQPIAGPRESSQRQPVRFAPGATVSAKVVVAASDRAVWARLVDRQTRQMQRIQWPPWQSTAAPAACP